MMIRLSAVDSETKMAISAKILVWNIVWFFVFVFIFFPPPVLPGSGSMGRQQKAVLSARLLSQLPKN
jgi:hypothetical protein